MKEDHIYKKNSQEIGVWDVYYARYPEKKSLPKIMKPCMYGDSTSVSL